jgi:hypothetical protein
MLMILRDFLQEYGLFVNMVRVLNVKQLFGGEVEVIFWSVFNLKINKKKLKFIFDINISKWSKNIKK